MFVRRVGNVVITDTAVGICGDPSGIGVTGDRLRLEGFFFVIGRHFTRNTADHIIVKRNVNDLSALRAKHLYGFCVFAFVSL